VLNYEVVWMVDDLSDDNNNDPVEAVPAKAGKTRDDFPKPTIRLLAQLVGYRCSNPYCGAPTIGPDKSDQIVILGVAAHIKAASPGGPRSDPSLTSEQRKHPDNGIWLCQNCGKLVDSDTSTYTAAQLRQWKADAISLARRALAMRDIDPDGRLKLARETRHVAAKRLLTITFKMTETVMAGMRLGPQAYRAALQNNSAVAATQTLKPWFDQSYEVEQEGNEALLEVRVVWGHDRGDRQFGPLAALDLWGYLTDCRAQFLTDLRALPGARRAAAASACGWNWQEIFRGNAHHANLLRAAQDQRKEAVETWAAPFIAGRPQRSP
jgi:hypothetical protein